MELACQVAEPLTLGPRKIREEVRRADPVKRSDTKIGGQRKMFGRRQTYPENPNFRSDGGKNQRILADPLRTRFICTSIRFT